jgi:peptidoglycan/LPS O-acetylase OafA/YrhL
MKHPDHQFAGLDHLRTLAITLVILYHYRSFQHPAWMDDSLHFGWSGVDLFFVLSGFLITNQLLARIKAGKGVGFANFYLKRFFRIIPPYLTILLIYIFIPAFHERESLPPLWKMFTFTQNFGMDISRLGTFSHAWSLCVEEQFYLLLPLALAFFLATGSWQKAAWAIPGLFLLTALLRWLTWHFLLTPLQGTDDFYIVWYRWIYYPTHTRLDGLVTGVGIAAIYQYREKWTQWMNRRSHVVLALATAG